jgi:hypothetical protein
MATTAFLSHICRVVLIKKALNGFHFPEYLLNFGSPFGLKHRGSNRLSAARRA